MGDAGYDRRRGRCEGMNENTVGDLYEIFPNTRRTDAGWYLDDWSETGVCDWAIT